MNEFLNAYYFGPWPYIAMAALSVLGGIGAAYWTRNDEDDQSAPVVVACVLFGVMAAIVLPVIVMLAAVSLISFAMYLFFRWVVT